MIDTLWPTIGALVLCWIIGILVGVQIGRFLEWRDNHKELPFGTSCKDCTWTGGANEPAGLDMIERIHKAQQPEHTMERWQIR